MTYYPEFQSTTSLSASDSVLIYSAYNADPRRTSLAMLADWIAEENASGDGKYTQRESPLETGFTVTIAGLTGTENEIWLRMTPLAAFASGTVVLPASNPDRRVVAITTSKQIASLALGLNGAIAAYGAPVAMSADACFKMIYDAGSRTWNRWD